MELNAEDEDANMGCVSPHTPNSLHPVHFNFSKKNPAMSDTDDSAGGKLLIDFQAYSRGQEAAEPEKNSGCESGESDESSAEEDFLSASPGERDQHSPVSDKEILASSTSVLEQSMDTLDLYADLSMNLNQDCSMEGRKSANTSDIYANLSMELSPVIKKEAIKEEQRVQEMDSVDLNLEKSKERKDVDMSDSFLFTTPDAIPVSPRKNKSSTPVNMTGKSSTPKINEQLSTAVKLSTPVSMSLLSEESNASVGMDLFTDFITTDHHEKNYRELNEVYEKSRARVISLEKELSETKEQRDALTLENCNLKNNMEALIKTARQELLKRDIVIAKLREQLQLLQTSPRKRACNNFETKKAETFTRCGKSEQQTDKTSSVAQIKCDSASSSKVREKDQCKEKETKIKEDVPAVSKDQKISEKEPEKFDLRQKLRQKRNAKESKEKGHSIDCKDKEGQRSSLQAAMENKPEPKKSADFSRRDVKKEVTEKSHPPRISHNGDKQHKVKTSSGTGALTSSGSSTSTTSFSASDLQRLKGYIRIADRDQRQQRKEYHRVNNISGRPSVIDENQTQIGDSLSQKHAHGTESPSHSPVTDSDQAETINNKHLQREEKEHQSSNLEDTELKAENFSTTDEEKCVPAKLIGKGLVSSDSEINRKTGQVSDVASCLKPEMPTPEASLSDKAQKRTNEELTKSTDIKLKKENNGEEKRCCTDDSKKKEKSAQKNQKHAEISSEFKINKIDNNDSKEKTNSHSGIGSKPLKHVKSKETPLDSSKLNESSRNTVLKSAVTSSKDTKEKSSHLRKKSKVHQKTESVEDPTVDYHTETALFISKESRSTTQEGAKKCTPSSSLSADSIVPCEKKTLVLPDGHEVLSDKETGKELTLEKLPERTSDRLGSKDLKEEDSKIASPLSSSAHHHKILSKKRKDRNMSQDQKLCEKLGDSNKTQIDLPNNEDSNTIPVTKNNSSLRPTKITAEKENIDDENMVTFDGIARTNNSINEKCADHRPRSDKPGHLNPATHKKSNRILESDHINKKLEAKSDQISSSKDVSQLASKHSETKQREHRCRKEIHSTEQVFNKKVSSEQSLREKGSGEQLSNELRTLINVSALEMKKFDNKLDESETKSTGQQNTPKSSHRSTHQKPLKTDRSIKNAEERMHSSNGQSQIICESGQNKEECHTVSKSLSENCSRKEKSTATLTESGIMEKKSYKENSEQKRKHSSFKSESKSERSVTSKSVKHTSRNVALKKAESVNHAPAAENVDDNTILVSKVSLDIPSDQVNPDCKDDKPMKKQSLKKNDEVENVLLKSDRKGKKTDTKDNRKTNNSGGEKTIHYKSKSKTLPEYKVERTVEMSNKYFESDHIDEKAKENAESTNQFTVKNDSDNHLSSSQSRTEQKEPKQMLDCMEMIKQDDRPHESKTVQQKTRESSHRSKLKKASESVHKSVEGGKYSKSGHVELICESKHDTEGFQGISENLKKEKSHLTLKESPSVHKKSHKPNSDRKRKHTNSVSCESKHSQSPKLKAERHITNEQNTKRTDFVNIDSTAENVNRDIQLDAKVSKDSTQDQAKSDTRYVDYDIGERNDSISKNRKKDEVRECIGRESTDILINEKSGYCRSKSETLPEYPKSISERKSNISFEKDRHTIKKLKGKSESRDQSSSGNLSNHTSSKHSETETERHRQSKERSSTEQMCAYVGSVKIDNKIIESGKESTKSKNTPKSSHRSKHKNSSPSVPVREKREERNAEALSDEVKTSCKSTESAKIISSKSGASYEYHSESEKSVTVLTASPGPDRNVHINSSKRKRTHSSSGTAPKNNQSAKEDLSKEGAIVNKELKKAKYINNANSAENTDSNIPASTQTFNDSQSSQQKTNKELINYEADQQISNSLESQQLKVTAKVKRKENKSDKDGKRERKDHILKIPNKSTINKADHSGDMEPSASMDLECVGSSAISDSSHSTKAISELCVSKNRNEMVQDNPDRNGGMKQKIRYSGRNGTDRKVSHDKQSLQEESYEGDKTRENESSNLESVVDRNVLDGSQSIPDDETVSKQVCFQDENSIDNQKQPFSKENVENDKAHTEESSDMQEVRDEEHHTSGVTDKEDMYDEESSASDVTDKEDVSDEESSVSDVTDQEDVSDEESSASDVTDQEDVSDEESSASDVTDQEDVSDEESSVSDVTDQEDVSDEESSASDVTDKEDVSDEESSASGVTDKEDVSDKESSASDVTDKEGEAIDEDDLAFDATYKEDQEGHVSDVVGKKDEVADDEGSESDFKDKEEEVVDHDEEGSAADVTDKEEVSDEEGGEFDVRDKEEEVSDEGSESGVTDKEEEVADEEDSATDVTDKEEEGVNEEGSESDVTDKEEEMTEEEGHPSDEDDSDETPKQICQNSSSKVLSSPLRIHQNVSDDTLLNKSPFKLPNFGKPETRIEKSSPVKRGYKRKSLESAFAQDILDIGIDESNSFIKQDEQEDDEFVIENKIAATLLTDENAQDKFLRSDLQTSLEDGEISNGSDNEENRKRLKASFRSSRFTKVKDPSRSLKEEHRSRSREVHNDRSLQKNKERSYPSPKDHKDRSHPRDSHTRGRDRSSLAEKRESVGGHRSSRERNIERSIREERRSSGKDQSPGHSSQRSRRENRLLEDRAHLSSDDKMRRLNLSPGDHARKKCPKADERTTSPYSRRHYTPTDDHKRDRDIYSKRSDSKRHGGEHESSKSRRDSRTKRSRSPSFSHDENYERSKLKARRLHDR